MTEQPTDHAKVCNMFEDALYDGYITEDEVAGEDYKEYFIETEGKADYMQIFNCPFCGGEL